MCIRRNFLHEQFYESPSSASLRELPLKSIVALLQVQFPGTVVKVAQPRMITKWKRFHCKACKTEFRVDADISQNNLCPTPTRSIKFVYMGSFCGPVVEYLPHDHEVMGSSSAGC